MQLILRAIRCPPDTPVQTAHFGAAGGTIGRSEECTLTLPDPKRHISRVHAQIRCRQGEYSLKVVSKVNPVFVNGVALAHNEAVEIKAGDTISLGDYEFTAALAEDALFPDAGAIHADPFAAFDVPRTASSQASEETVKDPFFFDRSPIDPVKGSAPGFPQPSPGNRSTPFVAEVGGQRPSDPLLNILEGKTTPASSGPSLASAPAPVVKTTIDQFLLEGGSGSPDRLGVVSSVQGSGMSTGGLGEHGDHVHDLNLPFQPPSACSKAHVHAPAASNSGLEADIFSDLLDATVPPSDGTQAGATPTPPVQQTEADIFSVLDDLVGPSPSPVTQPHASAAAAPVSTAAAAVQRVVQRPASPISTPEPVAADAVARLLDRFCVGLGVTDMKLAPEDAELFMSGAGKLLRAAIDGIFALLIMRAEVKKELRAEDRTMLASRENNPLKHSESVEEALRYLLEFKNPNPAFMPPVRAMQDAFNDVQAHEMAVMAGMRAGLAGVIKRFDPQALEPRIKKGGALDNVLPALHKSKLWEAYVDMYREIEQEVEDHFDRVFGREFVRAYMEQTKKLRRQSK